ncbi:MAG: TRAP transporter substrate-binding protein DctP [Rhodospirillales bacterium]|nr:TRAP transporter substrate-binding protein DctP [Rhodospirillales bacterium]
MTSRLTRRGFAAAAAGALAIPALHVRADTPLRLRASLDTAPSHGRNISIADYLQQIERGSDGRIRTELFQSGQLFPDLEVGKALVQGQVEMACPGSWTITGIIPDADLFQLPALYGRTLDDVHKAIDGRVGAIVADDIARRLRARVLGPWLDLGYQNWYSTSRKLESVADLRGMKIRNSGGAGQAWRARFLGAIPNTTAWPNVPLALSQGMFDGLVSTDESLASAKLWEAGVRYSLADHMFVGEYIPMVSIAFWNQLTPADQGMMTALWAKNIPTYRAQMAQRQTEARRLLVAHGVQIVDPTPQALAATRQKMLPDTAEVAKQIKVSPEIVRLVDEDVGVAG